MDCSGGHPEKPFVRASAFAALGYRTAILRDSDTEPDPMVDKAYKAQNGSVFGWRKGMCLEDELFRSLPKEGVCSLVDFAVKLYGDSLVDAHIDSISNGSKNLKSVQKDMASQTDISTATRALLGRAAQRKMAVGSRTYGTWSISGGG